jgi:hypothetical protein
MTTPKPVVTRLSASRLREIQGMDLPKGRIVLAVSDLLDEIDALIAERDAYKSESVDAAMAKVKALADGLYQSFSEKFDPVVTKEWRERAQRTEAERDAAIADAEERWADEANKLLRAKRSPEPAQAATGVSPSWVLSQLAGMQFRNPAGGDAYDYMKRSLVSALPAEGTPSHEPAQAVGVNDDPARLRARLEQEIQDGKRLVRELEAANKRASETERLLRDYADDALGLQEVCTLDELVSRLSKDHFALRQARQRAEAQLASLREAVAPTHTEHGAMLGGMGPDRGHRRRYLERVTAALGLDVDGSGESFGPTAHRRSSAQAGSNLPRQVHDTGHFDASPQQPAEVPNTLGSAIDMGRVAFADDPGEVAMPEAPASQADEDAEVDRLTASRLDPSKRTPLAPASQRELAARVDKLEEVLRMVIGASLAAASDLGHPAVHSMFRDALRALEAGGR